MDQTMENQSTQALVDSLRSLLEENNDAKNAPAIRKILSILRERDEKNPPSIPPAVEAVCARYLRSHPGA